jgi:hypothetical protein
MTRIFLANATDPTRFIEKNRRTGARGRGKMPIFRELTIAGAAVVLLLFISETFLGPDESHKLPWIGAAPAATERWLAKDSITSRKGAGQTPAEQRFSGDVTPQERISAVFDRFVPGKKSRAI